MTLHQTIVTQLVYGIPYEWFEEINAACDVYFKRKGIVWGQPLRDTITREVRLGRIKRKHRKH